MYLILADVVVALHAAFIVFVVGGQVLILAGWAAGWRWVRNLWLRLLHLLAIVFVVLEAWLSVPCPLTVLEWKLRRLAGVASYEGTFIGEWLHWLIFYDAPSWVFTVVYTAFAALVVVTFVGCRPKRKA